MKCYGYNHEKNDYRNQASILEGFGQIIKWFRLTSYKNKIFWNGGHRLCKYYVEVLCNEHEAEKLLYCLNNEFEHDVTLTY